mmetsp:Transcript_43609/g.72451  ORF Transcript_43609/g.72451 Transcript_43609/m.72451 type:complete len:582 (+) Transcript_43609:218-1963(+)
MITDQFGQRERGAPQDYYYDNGGGDYTNEDQQILSSRHHHPFAVNEQPPPTSRQNLMISRGVPSRSPSQPLKIPRSSNVSVKRRPQQIPKHAISSTSNPFNASSSYGHYTSDDALGETQTALAERLQRIHMHGEGFEKEDEYHTAIEQLGVFNFEAKDKLLKLQRNRPTTSTNSQKKEKEEDTTDYYNNPDSNNNTNSSYVNFQCTTSKREGKFHSGDEGEEDTYYGQQTPNYNGGSRKTQNTSSLLKHLDNSTFIQHDCDDYDKRKGKINISASAKRNYNGSSSSPSSRVTPDGYKHDDHFPPKSPIKDDDKEMHEYQRNYIFSKTTERHNTVTYPPAADDSSSPSSSSSSLSPCIETAAAAVVGPAPQIFPSSVKSPSPHHPLAPVEQQQNLLGMRMSRGFGLPSSSAEVDPPPPPLEGGALLDHHQTGRSRKSQKKNKNVYDNAKDVAASNYDDDDDDDDGVQKNYSLKRGDLGQDDSISAQRLLPSPSVLLTPKSSSSSSSRRRRRRDIIGKYEGGSSCSRDPPPYDGGGGKDLGIIHSAQQTEGLARRRRRREKSSTKRLKIARFGFRQGIACYET